MKHVLIVSTAAALLAATGAQAQTRYVAPPPAVVSPDLSAPWVLQLQRHPVGQRGHVRTGLPGVGIGIAPAPIVRERGRIAAEPRVRAPAPDRVETASVGAAARDAGPRLAEKFLPQSVA